jgi:hypothetical protein
MAEPTLAGLYRIYMQMATVGLLSLPNSPIRMQDIEDVLEHVILNDPMDLMAPSSQPADDIP